MLGSAKRGADRQGEHDDHRTAPAARTTSSPATNQIRAPDRRETTSELRTARSCRSVWAKLAGWRRGDPCRRRQRGSRLKERKGPPSTTACTLPRPAVEEGVVAGGGRGATICEQGFWQASTPLNSDQKVGIEIVRKAIQSPVRQNCGKCRHRRVDRGRQAGPTRANPNFGL